MGSLRGPFFFIGPDNKLYVALGQPFNVPPKEKMDLYRRVGIGGIIRMDQDGKNPKSMRRASATPSGRTSIPAINPAG